MDLPELPGWAVGLAIGMIYAGRRLPDFLSSRARRPRPRENPAPPPRFWWDRPDVKDAERRVLELNAGAADLLRLKQATDIICAVIDNPPVITLSGEGQRQSLGRERGPAHSVWVVVDGDTYRLWEQYCADLSDIAYPDLERVAWKLCGLHFRPRDIAAAARRLQKEGRSIERGIPITEIAKESSRDSAAGTGGGIK